MSDQISNRHESALGGQFLPFGGTEQVAVTLVISPELAHRPRVQHAAWMLLNLLSRQMGIVNHIGLICPRGVAQAGQIVPLVNPVLDLREALMAGNSAIGVVPLAPDQAEGRQIVVGAVSATEPGSLYLSANGWCGGISTSPVPNVGTESGLPFGPYVAACLAAGEVFQAARLRGSA